MEKNQTPGEYLAPEIKVKMLGIRSVICTSFDQINRGQGSWYEDE